jgi:hypothetical protein
MSDIDRLAAEMTAAASSFLDGLEPSQRRKANLPLEDDVERRRWFYTPNERGGLPLLELDSRHRQRAMRLLSTGLSEPGYNAAATIIGLDDILDRREGFDEVRPYPGRDGDWLFRNPGLYFVTVFGEPGREPWGWRVGGHHMSVQYTVSDGFIAATPCFFGANPAICPLPGGRMARPLGAEEDFARDLLALLRPDQRSEAVFSPVAPTDIVQSNRSVVEDGALPLPAQVMMSGRAGPNDVDLLRQTLGLTPELDDRLRFSFTPKGLSEAKMDAAQRDACRRLVGLYLERVPEAIRSQYEALLTGESLSFGWAGPTERGALHYYRIQSDRLLIEYDNTQDGGNHIHSVWRDLALDHGGDVLSKHYASAHGG